MLQTAPVSSITPPISISPVNNLLQQQQQQLAQGFNSSSLENSKVLLNASAAALLAHQFGPGAAQNGDKARKEKINALFEQTKKEEDRRRKLEEEHHFKVIMRNKNLNSFWSEIFLNFMK